MSEIASLLPALAGLATDPRSLTLLVTLGTLALFVWNRLSPDVVALLAMVALMVLGLVSPEQGISGFANEATLTVAAMLALSTGLLHTGAVDDLARWLQQAAGSSELRLLVLLIVIVLPFSAFVNNTAVVAVLLPIVLGVARDKDFSASRLLMPLSFSAQLGGTLTLVGTSTNLIVAGLALDLGLGRIGLFDITAAASVLVAVGVVYLLTLGRWLTPHREAKRDLVDAYQLRAYLASFRVLEDSPLAGRSLAASRLGEREGILVAGIRRGGHSIHGVGGNTVIEAGDELVVEGSVSDVARFVEQQGLEAMTDRPDWDFEVQADGEGAQPSEARAEHLGRAGRSDDQPGERILAELLVRPRTFPENQPLNRLGIRSRWNVTVLGLQRRGRPLKRGLHQTALRAGDVLLVEGRPDDLRAIHEAGDFSLLGAVDIPARRRGKRSAALSILAGVVLLPAFGIGTILITSIAGVAAMFLTGTLKPREAYDEMDWMVIVLLGAILPLGIAMEETGTAILLVDLALGPMQAMGPYGVLALFYLGTSLLTSVISNAAAAVVTVPLAVAASTEIGVSPMPLVVAVMFAASNSFVTPIGYQTNTFIFGPGGYHFTDFFRVGSPLTLVLLLAATLTIPIFFPFTQ